MAQVKWAWIAMDDERAEVDQLGAEVFASQSEAETWLGENWRTLRDDGATQVRLLSDEEEVYVMRLDEG